MTRENFHLSKFLFLLATASVFYSCNFQIRKENYKKEIINGKVIYKKKFQRGDFFLRYTDNQKIDSILILGNGNFFKLIDSGTVVHKKKSSYVLYFDNLNSENGRYNDSAALIY